MLGLATILADASIVCVTTAGQLAVTCNQTREEMNALGGIETIRSDQISKQAFILAQTFVCT
jgi:hypothetical protein